MLQRGFAFKDSKEASPWLEESSAGRSTSIPKSHDIDRWLLLRRSFFANKAEIFCCCARRVNVQSENQISEQAHVNHLPQSKRSLAGIGGRTRISRFGRGAAKRG